MIALENSAVTADTITATTTIGSGVTSHTSTPTPPVSLLPSMNESDNENHNSNNNMTSRLLSPEEKRLHHLQSEQRRRQQLKGALDVLDQIVPIPSTDRKSTNTEATVINRAIQYIKILLNERATLESHLMVKNQQQYARHAQSQVASSPANMHMMYHPTSTSSAHMHAQMQHHVHAQAHAHGHPHAHAHLHSHAHTLAHAHAQQAQSYAFPYTH